MIYYDTLDSEEVAVLLARPDYTSPVELEPYLDVAISSVLEGQEDRVSNIERLRYRLRWRGFLETGQMTDFRLGLGRLKAQKVCCPFWIEEEPVVSIDGSVVTLDGTWCYTTDRVIIYDRLGNYEILEANRGAQTSNTVTLTSSPSGSWSGEFYIAPLFFGAMVQRPNLTGLTDEAASIDLTIEDMAAFSNALLPVSGSVDYAGTMIPDFTSKPIFPLWPHDSSPTDTDELTIDYTEIGFLRQKQIAYYNAEPKRGNTLNFQIHTKEEAAALVSFFVTQLGPVKPFFLPTHRGDLRLSRSVTGSGAVIYCESNARYHAEFNSVSKHPGTDFLALVSRDSIRVVQVDSTAISGGELVLTAHENIGEDFDLSETKVSFLHLSRFSEASMRLSFETNHISDVSVRFLECAEEYLEVSNTGADTTKAITYKFYTDIAGYTVWRHTSFERSVTNTDGTYTPAPFEHSGLKNSLNVESAEVEIKSHKFSGNPIQQLIPYNIEKPLYVEIREVEADDPNTGRTLFVGEVKGARARGQVISAKCVALGKTLERKLPWMLFQRACNHDVYCLETCGIDQDDHEVNGVIDALNASLFYVDVASMDNSGGTRPDQYFAQGWIEIGTGNSMELRSILRSEDIGSSKQRLYIHRPLAYASVSDDIKFWPGCDKSYNGDNGCPKFGTGKEIRFGGFPNMPETNPSIEAIPLEQGQARRK